MQRIIRTLAIVLILTAATAWAAEETRWINVKVTEPDTETNVELHLPMDLVIAVLEGVEVENFHYGKVEIELDDCEVDWPSVLAGILDAPDGDFVDVTSEDGDVQISKKMGMVHIKAKEKGGDNADVEITFPMKVVSALTVDEENRVDVVALLESIDELPTGDLVRVTSDEANVRIWVE